MAFRAVDGLIAVASFAVTTAGVGALQGSNPALGAGLGVAIGAAAGFSLPARSERASFSGWLAAALLPIAIGPLEALAEAIAGATGASLLAMLPFVAIGIPLGLTARRWSRGQVGAALAGVIAGGLLLASVATRVPGAWLGLGGLLGLIVPARGALPSRSGGVAAGIVLGSVPLLAAAAAPMHGADATWWGTAAAGLALGAMLGRARGPRTAALDGLGALGLGAAAAVLTRLPDAGVAWFAAEWPAELGGLPGPSTATTVLATAILGATLPAIGRRTAPVALAAAVAGAFGLGVLGWESAVLVAAGIAAAAALPQAVVGERRVVATLAVAAGFGALLLPPAPSGARAVAPFAAPDPSGLADAVQRHGPRDVDESASVFGGAAWARRGRVTHLWAGSVIRTLDPEQRASDRFFGLLPALLQGDPERVLVLGDVTGTVADAARRVAASTVLLQTASKPRAQAIRALAPENRDVAVDPAVRLTRRRVEARGRWDAILVDLPPPGAPGGRQAWSASRVRRLAARLADGGLVAFRVPVAALAPEELAGWLAEVVDAFPAVSAWLDPSGGRHLLVLGHGVGGPLDAGAVFRAWTRAALREELAGTALASPMDVLERAIAGTDALATAASGPQRGADVAAVRSGLRVRRGRRGGALVLLSSGLQPPAFDLDGIPVADRASAAERLKAAAAVRSDYLALLESLDRGDSADVLARATALAGASGATAKDLRAVIEPWLRRGRAYRRQGLLDQARGEFLVASQLSPADVDVAVELGDVLRRLDALPEAEEAYGRALEQAPDSVAGRFGLADVRTRQGRFDQAVTLLEGAENIDPGNPDVLSNLAFNHLQMARGDQAGLRLERARVLWQRAAALAPRMPQPHAGLATVFEQLDRIEDALSSVERARTLAPENCLYQGQRAVYLERLGRLDEAAADLQAMLLRCPDAPDALNLLAVVYTQQGKQEQALDLYRRTLELDPDHVGAQANLRKLELIRGAQQR